MDDERKTQEQDEDVEAHLKRGLKDDNEQEDPGFKRPFAEGDDDVEAHIKNAK